MEWEVPENFIESGVEKGAECWAGEIKGGNIKDGQEAQWGYRRFGEIKQKASAISWGVENSDHNSRRDIAKVEIRPPKHVCRYRKPILKAKYEGNGAECSFTKAEPSNPRASKHIQGPGKPSTNPIFTVWVRDKITRITKGAQPPIDKPAETATD